MFTFKNLLLAAIGLFIISWWCKGQSSWEEDSVDTRAKILEKFTQKHPGTGDWLATQRALYGDYAMAVAVQSKGNSTLTANAMQQEIAVRARLTAIYEQDRANDESVLWTHGTAVEALSELPSNSDAYLTRLETAQQDSAYWSLVRNDPVALSSKLMRDDLNVREYYRDNQEWFHKMLDVLVSMIEPTDADAASVGLDELADCPIEIDDLLRVATDTQPYLITSLPDPAQTPIESCIYFETFRKFGEVIAKVSKQGVPTNEATEVILMNRDALLSDVEEDPDTRLTSPDLLAARLVRLHREKPSVWYAAQRDGFVLTFDELVPGISQSILENNPDIGVASLIVSQYRGVASQAAMIVEKYGELGLAILVQYSESERFASLLANANVDYRVAMVAAAEADAGLESVASNPAYVDKVIGEDGQPRKPEWWKNIPLAGGIAAVVKNQAKGHPTDWSEIGWAAWDAVDIALLVATAGSSKVATEGAKQAAKGVGRQAAKKLTAASIKRSAKVEAGMLSRLVLAAKQTKFVPLRWTARTTIRVGGAAKTGASQALRISKSALATVKNVSPATRTWIARGLLGVSLFVRGPKQMVALMHSLNDWARKITKDTLNAIPDAISNAIANLKESVGGSFSSLTFFAVLGLAILAAVAVAFDLIPIPARTKKLAA